MSTTTVRSAGSSPMNRRQTRSWVSSPASEPALQRRRRTLSWRSRLRENGVPASGLVSESPTKTATSWRWEANRHASLLGQDDIVVPAALRGVPGDVADFPGDAAGLARHRARGHERATGAARQGCRQTDPECHAHGVLSRRPALGRRSWVGDAPVMSGRAARDASAVAPGVACYNLYPCAQTRRRASPCRIVISASRPRRS